MKLKSLAKCLARSNGGNVEKAREILEHRRIDIEWFGYEDAFENERIYKRVDYDKAIFNKNKKEVNFNE